MKRAHPTTIRTQRGTLRAMFYRRLRQLGLPPALVAGANIEERAEALLHIAPSPSVQHHLARLRELCGDAATGAT